jgi:hypothetical protein
MPVQITPNNDPTIQSQPPIDYGSMMSTLSQFLDSPMLAPFANIFQAQLGNYMAQWKYLQQNIAQRYGGAVPSGSFKDLMTKYALQYTGNMLQNLGGSLAQLLPTLMQYKEFEQQMAFQKQQFRQQFGLQQGLAQAQLNNQAWQELNAPGFAQQVMQQQAGQNTLQQQQLQNKAIQSQMQYQNSIAQMLQSLSGSNDNNSNVIGNNFPPGTVGYQQQMGTSLSPQQAQQMASQMNSSNPSSLQNIINASSSFTNQSNTGNSLNSGISSGGYSANNGLQALSSNQSNTGFSLNGGSFLGNSLNNGFSAGGYASPSTNSGFLSSFINGMNSQLGNASYNNYSNMNTMPSVNPGMNGSSPQMNFNPFGGSNLNTGINFNIGGGNFGSEENFNNMMGNPSASGAVQAPNMSQAQQGSTSNMSSAP